MIAVAILFQSFEPIGIDGFLGKAGQLGQEFMSDLGENLLGLLRISESHHAVRIEGWEIQDRLPQANEDGFVADQTNLRRFTGTISSGIPI